MFIFYDNNTIMNSSWRSNLETVIKALNNSSNNKNVKMRLNVKTEK